MFKYIAIGLIVIAGAGAYASRETLKTYFQNGDIPNQEEFADTIDSALNMQDDGQTVDQKTVNPTKEYVPRDTSVKSDTIYQAKVLTEPETLFTLTAPDPVTFTWSPAPSTGEPVTYRLKVWQLMQGQTGAQVMKSGEPVATKDVTNAHEVTISSLYTGPCRPPYLCDFIWSVEVVRPSTNDTGAGTATDSSTGTR